MTTDKQQGALIVNARTKILIGMACLSGLILASNAFSQTGRPPSRNSTVRNTAPRTANRSTQPRTSSTRRGPVAVVDVSYIFQNHRGFKSAMDSMKEEVQAFESKIRARQEELTKKREGLTRYKSGTANYKQLEQELADGMASLQVDTQLKKKEFLEREARVYYNTYQQINGVIEDYATKTNIGLVLRFTRQPIDPNNRQSVLAGVNRAVVYERGMDITGDILNLIDRVPRSSNPRMSSQPSRSTGSRVRQ